MHILFPGFDTWPVVTDQNVLVPEMCTWKHLAKSRLDVSSLPSDGSRKPNGREGGEGEEGGCRAGNGAMRTPVNLS